MIRIVNDHLGRALHAPLYQRLYNFCLQYCPELPPDVVVNAIMQRLYNNDTSLYVMVSFDNQYNITEHAVIDIQNSYGYNVVYCHQLQRDTPDKNSQDEFMEFLNKLAESVNAVTIMFTVTKNYRVYEKKYGYKTVRHVMMKTSLDLVNEKEEVE